MEMQIIPSINEFANYTRDDYDTDKPFETLAKIIANAPARKNQMLDKASEYAHRVGVTKFRTYFKDWAREHTENKAIQQVTQNNVTSFDGQPMELNCGAFVSTEDGITATDRQGNEVMVCPHPIMPVMRLENIDTNETKFTIMFSRNGDARGRKWKPPIIVPKSTLANASKIIELANYDIAVDSESSKYLVRYFTTLDAMNYDTIPYKSSVGRLGWIKGYGFAPYIDNVEFDGAEQFKDRYEAVKPFGSKEKWDELVTDIRKNGTVYANIMMASALASILVEPCNCLPFFVHLWGGTEAGKTVALMLACSVWANPDLGKYITTFNSTMVGQELSAAFCNSLPLIMDELQIQTSGGRKDFDQIIYQLTEGVGKQRGRKEGGLDKQKTWKNAILTSGEYPINTEASGGGSVNRTIELDCKDTKIFESPTEVVAVLRENYGFLGKEIVEILQDEETLHDVVSHQVGVYKELLSLSKFTDKQCASASLILTASWLMDKYYFHDGLVLKMSDITPYLTGKDEVSQNLRAWQNLQDWVGMYYSNFSTEYNSPLVCYGKIETNPLAAHEKLVHINKRCLNNWATENGYNSKGFISWCLMNGKMLVNEGRKDDHMIRLNGVLQKMYCFKFTEDGFADEITGENPSLDELPI